MDQTNPVKRTGMIGLGAMGLQFARHMQRKGFDVAGYDINADAVRRAENDGIRHRGSPAEIGKHSPKSWLSWWRPTSRSKASSKARA